MHEFHAAYCLFMERNVNLLEPSVGDFAGWICYLKKDSTEQHQKISSEITDLRQDVVCNSTSLVEFKRQMETMQLATKSLLSELWNQTQHTQYNTTTVLQAHKELERKMLDKLNTAIQIASTTAGKVEDLRHITRSAHEIRQQLTSQTDQVKYINDQVKGIEDESDKLIQRSDTHFSKIRKDVEGLKASLEKARSDEDSQIKKLEDSHRDLQVKLQSFAQELVFFRGRFDGQLREIDDRSVELLEVRQAMREEEDNLQNQIVAAANSKVKLSAVQSTATTVHLAAHSNTHTQMNVIPNTTTNSSNQNVNNQASTSQNNNFNNNNVYNNIIGSQSIINGQQPQISQHQPQQPSQAHITLLPQSSLTSPSPLNQNEFNVSGQHTQINNTAAGHSHQVSNQIHLPTTTIANAASDLPTPSMEYDAEGIPSTRGDIFSPASNNFLVANPISTHLPTSSSISSPANANIVMNTAGNASNSGFPMNMVIYHHASNMASDPNFNHNLLMLHQQQQHTRAQSLTTNNNPNLSSNNITAAISHKHNSSNKQHFVSASTSNNTPFSPTQQQQSTAQSGMPSSNVAIIYDGTSGQPDPNFNSVNLPVIIPSRLLSNPGIGNDTLLQQKQQQQQQQMNANNNSDLNLSAQHQNLPNKNPHTIPANSLNPINNNNNNNSSQRQSPPLNANAVAPSQQISSRIQPPIPAESFDLQQQQQQVLNNINNNQSVISTESPSPPPSARGPGSTSIIPTNDGRQNIAVGIAGRVSTSMKNIDNGIIYSGHHPIHSNLNEGQTDDTITTNNQDIPYLIVESNLRSLPMPIPSGAVPPQPYTHNPSHLRVGSLVLPSSIPTSQHIPASGNNNNPGKNSASITVIQNNNATNSATVNNNFSNVVIQQQPPHTQNSPTSSDLAHPIPIPSVIDSSSVAALINPQGNFFSHPSTPNGDGHAILKALGNIAGTGVQVIAPPANSQLNTVSGVNPNVSNSSNIVATNNMNQANLASFPNSLNLNSNFPASISNHLGTNSNRVIAPPPQGVTSALLPLGQVSRSVSPSVLFLHQSANSTAINTVAPINVTAPNVAANSAAVVPIVSAQPTQQHVKTRSIAAFPLSAPVSSPPANLPTSNNTAAVSSHPPTSASVAHMRQRSLTSPYPTSIGPPPPSFNGGTMLAGETRSGVLHYGLGAGMNHISTATNGTTGKV